MNPIKKILVNFKQTRGIYEPHNLVYKTKYNPSNQKEMKRIERRMKKINRYDDEETKEPPIDALSSNKARLMFKMITDMHNSHRLSRKEIPKEEKAEYIKKAKEYSLFRTNLWRHQFDETKKCLRREEETLKASCLLPMYLVDEVMDVEGLYNDGDDLVENQGKIEDVEDDFDKIDQKKGVQRGAELPVERERLFRENQDNVESLEFTPEYLYLPQIMRIFPDDYHIVYKTLINMSAYETSKQGGIDEQGDSFGGGADDN
jgi:hypothetical protein